MRHIKKPEEKNLNEEAPLFHVLPYMTGGYKRLLETIKTDNIPELAEFGFHTDKDGHFDPRGECLIGLRYKVTKLLDTKGQSAVLVLAQDEFRHMPVVIKVLHTHFYPIGGQESNILRKLATADPLNLSHTSRLLTTLTFDGHFCLVFEPLLPDPIGLLFSNRPTYKKLSDLRQVGLRLLASVGFLHQQNLIHTDLKPDNILLKYENNFDSVHIVDFGNTIQNIHSEVSLYCKDYQLQTPLYRAPEVMFGIPFGPKIDIWSLGCVLAELYLGKPLFYGADQEESIEQMIELLGPFPRSIFREGKYYKGYKNYTTDETQPRGTMKLLDHLQCKDVHFADLIAQLLNYNPEERLTVAEAASHPFFASYLPLNFLLPKSLVQQSYPVCISDTAYTLSPDVATEIKREQMSSVDLLRYGTSLVKLKPDATVIHRPSPQRKGYSDIGGTYNQNVSSPLPPGRDSKCLNDSDMSLVRNFIERSDPKTTSKDVKDKMSALLEVIKNEQDSVEEDLERRGRNDYDHSHSAATRQYSDEKSNITRPCPRYAKVDMEDRTVNSKKQNLNAKRTGHHSGRRAVQGGNIYSRTENTRSTSESERIFEAYKMEKISERKDTRTGSTKPTSESERMFEASKMDIISKRKDAKSVDPYKVHKSVKDIMPSTDEFNFSTHTNREISSEYLKRRYSGSSIYSKAHVQTSSDTGDDSDNSEHFLAINRDTKDSWPNCQQSETPCKNRLAEQVEFQRLKHQMKRDERSPTNFRENFNIARNGSTEKLKNQNRLLHKVSKSSNVGFNVKVKTEIDLSEHAKFSELPGRKRVATETRFNGALVSPKATGINKKVKSEVDNEYANGDMSGYYQLNYADKIEPQANSGNIPAMKKKTTLGKFVLTPNSSGWDNIKEEQYRKRNSQMKNFAIEKQDRFFENCKGKSKSSLSKSPIVTYKDDRRENGSDFPSKQRLHEERSIFSNVKMNQIDSQVASKRFSDNQLSMVGVKRKRSSRDIRTMETYSEDKASVAEDEFRLARDIAKKELKQQTKWDRYAERFALHQ